LLPYVQLVGIKNFMSTAQNRDIKILCKSSHWERGCCPSHASNSCKYVQ